MESIPFSDLTLTGQDMENKEGYDEERDFKENMVIIDLSGRGLKRLDRTRSASGDASPSSCTTLILDTNAISKVEHLEEYHCLQQLSIASNRLVRMNGVSKMTTLRVLNLPNNSIQSIEGLRDLINLEWLNLSGNSIKVIDHLNCNMKLKHLDLSDNSISSVTDISMLTNLKTLLLHGNILTSLRSIPAYFPTSIEILSLAENEIPDLAEVSYLSCLAKLQQLSIMNNPCVMMATSSSDSCFDYRPYIINWCLSIHILDGYAVTQKESLKGEWLYSQGRGRCFHPGHHAQLVDYLSHTCPVTSETESKEDEKLIKVLKQQRLHQKQLQQTPTPLYPGLLDQHTPSQSQHTPAPSNHRHRSPHRTTPSPTKHHSPPRSSSRPSAAKTSPKQLPAVSPPTAPSEQDRRAHGYAGHTTAWDDSQGHNVHSKAISMERENLLDMVLQDLEDEETMSNSSQLISESLYIPVTNETSPPKSHDQRPLTAPPHPIPSRDVGPEDTRLATAFPFNQDLATAHIDTGQESFLTSHGITKYEAYDSRPVKPLKKDKKMAPKATSHLMTPNAGSRKPRSLPGRHSSPSTPTPGTPTPGTPTRHRSPNREDARKDDTFSSAELKRIKEIANSRRVGKTPPPASPSQTKQTKKRDRRGVTVERIEQRGYEVKGHGVSRPQQMDTSAHSGSTMNLHSESTAMDKSHDREVQAAIKIQAFWRGHRARRHDPVIIDTQNAIRVQRVDDHIKFLNNELDRTRQLYEQEKQLRTLQMEALKLLWSQVKTLHDWKHDVELREDRFPDRKQTKSVATSPLLTTNADGTEVFVFPELRTSQADSSQDSLQQQVTRLQESMDAIFHLISAGGLNDALSGNGAPTSSSPPPKIKTPQMLESSQHSPEMTLGKPSQPKNLQATLRSDTSLCLSWEPSVIDGPPTSEKSSGPPPPTICGYRLHVTKQERLLETIEVPTTRAILGGLLPGTYSFTVQAYTKSQESPKSEAVCVEIPSSGKITDEDQYVQDMTSLPVQHSEGSNEAVEKNAEDNSSGGDSGQVEQDDMFSRSDDEERRSVSPSSEARVIDDSQIEQFAAYAVAREMSLAIVEEAIKSALGGAGPPGDGFTGPVLPREDPNGDSSCGGGGSGSDVSTNVASGSSTGSGSAQDSGKSWTSSNSSPQHSLAPDNSESQPLEIPETFSGKPISTEHAFKEDCEDRKDGQNDVILFPSYQDKNESFPSSWLNLKCPEDFQSLIKLEDKFCFDKGDTQIPDDRFLPVFNIEGPKEICSGANSAFSSSCDVLSLKTHATDPVKTQSNNRSSKTSKIRATKSGEGSLRGARKVMRNLLIRDDGSRSPSPKRLCNPSSLSHSGPSSEESGECSKPKLKTSKLAINFSPQKSEVAAKLPFTPVTFDSQSMKSVELDALNLELLSLTLANDDVRSDNRAGLNEVSRIMSKIEREQKDISSGIGCYAFSETTHVVSPLFQESSDSGLPTSLNQTEQSQSDTIHTTSSDPDNEPPPGRRFIKNGTGHRKNLPAHSHKINRDVQQPQEPSQESVRASQRSPTRLGSPGKSRLPRMFCGIPEPRARSASPSTKMLSPKKKAFVGNGKNGKADKMEKAKSSDSPNETSLHRSRTTATGANSHTSSSPCKTKMKRPSNMSTLKSARSEPSLYQKSCPLSRSPVAETGPNPTAKGRRGSASNQASNPQGNSKIPTNKHLAGGGSIQTRITSPPRSPMVQKHKKDDSTNGNFKKPGSNSHGSRQGRTSPNTNNNNCTMLGFKSAKFTSVKTITKFVQLVEQLELKVMA